MNVGERIRENRARMGLSQEELEQRALVSRPTLSHWETGRTLPDAQSLLILSQIFGVTIDDLVLGDADEMRNMVQAEANHPTRSSHRGERVRPYHGWPDGSPHGWQRGPALPGGDLRDHVHSPNHARAGACRRCAIRRRGTEGAR